MKNQSRFVSAIQVFVALVFLAQAFLHFQSALQYGGLENNFLADNWGTFLSFLLTTIFGLGWWVGSFIGNLALSEGWKTTVPAFLGILLLFVSLEFGSLAIFPLGFTRYALMASGHSLISGFFLRFSMISPEIMVKKQNRN